nr:hypothetical protein [Cryobacterium sp. TMT1-3]
MVGVEGIGFAAQPTLGTVGTIDLKHTHSGIRQNAGKFRTVGTGSFDANSFDDAVGVEELDDFAVAAPDSEELPVGDRLPMVVNDSDLVRVFVGINSGEDGSW